MTKTFGAQYPSASPPETYPPETRSRKEWVYGTLLESKGVLPQKTR
jgi:hypothetical protein